MKRILLCGLILVIQTGCMLTKAYQKSNEEYGNSLREFDTQSDTNFKIFRGVRKSTGEADGTTTHHFQFEGPLKGKDRYLDVILSSKERSVPAYDLVPGKGLVDSATKRPAPGSMLIFESEKKISGDSPAYLIVQVTQPFYSESNQDYIYSVLEQKVGKPSHPVAIVKRHFNFDIKDPEAPMALVILNLSNTYQYSADALVWDAAPDGAAVVSSIGIDLNPYDGPRFGIAWKERSRPVYILRQAGTIGTVLADVVTAPIQLVLILLMAIGGGGVR